jgi:hypothetical protein
MNGALASQERVRFLSFAHNDGGIRRPARRIPYPRTFAQQIGWSATPYAIKRLKRVYKTEDI